MIEQNTQTAETDQKRKERRAARRNAKRRYVKKNCCRECGQPKHYICLEHNSNLRKPLWKRFISKSRYNSRKLFFNLARKVGFVD